MLSKVRKCDEKIYDKAINDFVAWAYANGIDFSYMSTNKKTAQQWCEEVICRFKTEKMKEGLNE